MAIEMRWQMIKVLTAVPFSLPLFFCVWYNPKHESMTLSPWLGRQMGETAGQDLELPRVDLVFLA